MKKQKTIKQLKAKAWELFSLYIRYKYSKDGLCTCYTCGKKVSIKQAQAGHGISGRGNAILFDENIVRPQCLHCNVFLHGNYQIFVPKLIREIGQNMYEELERQSHLPVKRDRTYYEDLIEELKVKLSKFSKRLEK